MARPYDAACHGEARMRIVGTVVEEESGKPIADLRVRGYDKDWVFDDRLGDTITDAQGRFEISYTEIQFRDLEETLPDVYIRVFDSTGKQLLYSSEKAVRRNATVLELFDVKIPRAKHGRPAGQPA
jgi:carotenoid cleavage dioxygenase